MKSLFNIKKWSVEFRYNLALYLFIFFVHFLTTHVLDASIFHTNAIVEDLGIYLGFLLGFLLAAFILENTVIRYKLRVKSLIVTGFFCLIICSISWSVLQIYMTWDLYDIYYNNSLKDSNFFMSFVFSCFIFSPIIYLTLHRFTTSFLFVFVGLFVLYIWDNTRWTSNHSLRLIANDGMGTRDLVEFGILNGILMIFLFFLVFLYFLSHSRFKFKEALGMVHLRKILILVMILIFSSIFASLLLRNLAKKQEMINEAQMVQEEKVDSDINLDEKIVPAVAIVGYYKAEKPLYLKTTVFDVDMDYDKLEIKEKKNRGDYYFVYDERPRDKNVKVVYYQNGDDYLPSTIDIGYFEELNYQDELGLLRDRYFDESKIVSYEFWYDDVQTGPSAIDYSYNYDPNDYTKLSNYSSEYEQIADLAFEITRGKVSEEEKAKAIEKYLNDNYTYTLNPGIEDKSRPISEFLFKTKKGYCAHFATSMTILLEAVGIESRLVGGFYSPTYLAELDSYVFLTNNLHVWVEARVDGSNWQLFEPTTSNLDASSGLEPMDVTGPGLDGVSNEVLVQLVMQSIDPTLSFDDMYDIDSLDEDLDDMGIDEDTDPVDFDMEEEDIEGKEDEDEDKENDDNQDKFSFSKCLASNAKYIAVVFGMIILMIISLFVSRKLFYRIKYRDYFKKLHQIKKTRELDLNLREIVIKKQNLSYDLLDLNPRKFMSRLDAKQINQKDLRLFYQLVDKILYSRQFDDMDFDRLKSQYDQIKASI